MSDSAKKKRYEATKEWKKNNRAKCNANQRKYYQSLRSNTPEMSKDKWAVVQSFYEYADRLCGIFGNKSFVVDHTVPIAAGGKHHPSNLQVVPDKWNSSKGSRHSKIWEAPYV